MSSPAFTPHASEVQAAAELYQQAAQALLLAYQRNKEATRHHAHGAFRAALHHASESVAHASAAHAHLQQALAISMSLSCGVQAGTVLSHSSALRQDH